jgi:HlyD family secretion protein
MPATVRIVGTERDIPGKVVRVAPAVDPTTLLGRLRVQLDGSPRVPVGSAATGTVITGSHVGLLVPSSALRRSPVGSDEIVVCDGSVARVRTVAVGPHRDGMVAIADGLRAGEQVVSDHVLGLEEGQPIAPERAKSP